MLKNAQKDFIQRHIGPSDDEQNIMLKELGYKNLDELIKEAHKHDMLVILDWVANHTGWDHKWIENKPDYYTKNENGEITDPINPSTGESWGWTDVADLNYKNMQMREALRKAMVYWVEETNIDGYRIDQAYAVPQEFYNKTFAILKRIKPLFLLAETDIYHPGGLDLVKKFDASYDWPGHHLSKKVARGQKNALNYSRHIERTIKRYGPENIVVNFVSNHDENSWNGTIEESYGKAAYAFMALNYTIPGMPLVYSGQEYDLNKRLHFFEKDSFPKVSGKTMEFLQQLGALKNNHKALTSGLSGGSFRRLLNSKNDQILAFERERDGDTIVFIANLSKDYAQFTLPYEGNFKRFQDFKNKRLSSSYQYDMKPWEFWILTN